MGRTIKHAIVVEGANGERLLLPSYRYRRDAKLAVSRLVELDGVKSARTTETTLESPSGEDEAAMLSR